MLQNPSTAGYAVCAMPADRLYIHRTPAVERALSLVSEVTGVPRSASVPKKLEAWIAYTTHHVEDGLAYEARLAAYEELARVPGRRERVKRSSRAAAERGLL